MKYKVSELEGALLDSAVCLAEGWVRNPGGGSVPTPGGGWLRPINIDLGDQPSVLGSTWEPTPQFSSMWLHGGPIIEREHVAVEFEDFVNVDSAWTACIGDTEKEGHDGWSFGATPLIAAMRAYVYFKFGPEIELP